MNFGTLKSDVQSAMGRTDIPDYVYTLTTSGLNRDLRVLEMQCVTTLYADGETIDLPSNFLEVESAYIDAGGYRNPVLPLSERSQAVHHDSAGRPYYYSIHKDTMTLMPVPDSSYEMELRYYERLEDLSTDADTNDVMDAYPGLYLYGALTHAAVWAKDTESAQVYNSAYITELEKLEKQDIQRRYAGPIAQRSIRSVP